MTIPELYELFIHNPKVTTDSRNCPRGSIFFALKGDKFDGNQYAEKALASGCVYAVIDNPDYFIGERTILVDNVLTTLQQLAHRHRKVIGCPIIGDDKYFGGERCKLNNLADKLFLHAYKIDLSGLYNKKMVITAPLPGHFRQAFEQLGIEFKE